MLPKLSAENAVLVAQQVSRDLLKGERLSKLLGGPLRCGVGGYIEMHDTSPVVSQYQEHVQDLKPDRWNSEEVDRHHGLDVILKEGAPSLGGRPTMTRHVLADAGLTDVNTELEKLAVNARCTPKRVLAAHSADQFPNVFRYRRPSMLPGPDLPCPEQTEALPVPGDHGLRLDDQQRRSPIAPDLADPSPEESIGGRQCRPLY